MAGPVDWVVILRSLVGRGLLVGIVVSSWACTFGLFLYQAKNKKHSKNL